jgi:hypothetical protein
MRLANAQLPTLWDPFMKKKAVQVVYATSESSD